LAKKLAKYGKNNHNLPKRNFNLHGRQGESGFFQPIGKAQSNSTTFSSKQIRVFSFLSVQQKAV